MQMWPLSECDREKCWWIRRDRGGLTIKKQASWFLFPRYRQKTLRRPCHRFILLSEAAVLSLLPLFHGYTAAVIGTLVKHIFFVAAVKHLEVPHLREKDICCEGQSVIRRFLPWEFHVFNSLSRQIDVVKFQYANSYTEDRWCFDRARTSMHCYECGSYTSPWHISYDTCFRNLGHTNSVLVSSTDLFEGLLYQFVSHRLGLQAFQLAVLTQVVCIATVDLFLASNYLVFTIGTVSHFPHSVLHA